MAAHEGEASYTAKAIGDDLGAKHTAPGPGDGFYPLHPGPADRAEVIFVSGLMPPEGGPAATRNAKAD